MVSGIIFLERGEQDFYAADILNSRKYRVSMQSEKSRSVRANTPAPAQPRTQRDSALAKERKNHQITRKKKKKLKKSNNLSSKRRKVVRVPARREGAGCPPVDFTPCLVPSPAFLDLFDLFSATGNKQVMPEPGEAEGTGGMRDAPHFLLPLFPPISLPGSFLVTRNERKIPIKAGGEDKRGRVGI